MPTMLQPVDYEFHDLLGLEKKQIFRLTSDRFKAAKSYGECTGCQRDRFAQALFREVEKKLKDHFVEKSSR